jgi:predicted flap endonuclease-1-like 5' DNA nuclease
MSTLFVILAPAALIVTAVAGAFGMRLYMERNRMIAEREDPRDTKIRDLQATIKLTRKDLTLKRTNGDETTDHLKFAHARIDELLGRISKLKDKHASCVALLEKEIGAKDVLQDKLSVAKTQLETMKECNQELELQLQASDEPDMLNPSNHEPDSNSHEVDDEPLADMFSAPLEEDDSPSLIQSLTGELDRWRHHCHVLGNELKNQRERITPEPANQSFDTADNIDELTDIRGIGTVLARKLHELGIFRFQELINLGTDDLERAEALIPDLGRRMKRDDWIEQARSLYQNKYNAAICA